MNAAEQLLHMYKIKSVKALRLYTPLPLPIDFFYIYVLSKVCSMS